MQRFPPSQRAHISSCIDIPSGSGHPNGFCHPSRSNVLGGAGHPSSGALAIPNGELKTPYGTSMAAPNGILVVPVGHWLSNGAGSGSPGNGSRCGNTGTLVSPNGVLIAPVGTSIAAPTSELIAPI